MATLWPPDQLWTSKNAECSGMLGGSHPLGNKQAARYSSVRNAALLLPKKSVAGEQFSSYARPKEQVQGQGKDQEEELVWQQFFRNPTVLRDSARDKKRSRSPDFRHRGSGGGALKINSRFEPTWVDEQPISLSTHMVDGSSASKSSSTDEVAPARREGSELDFVTAGAVRMLCQQGKLSQAVEALEYLARTDSAISQSLFYSVLKLCIAKKDLVAGRRVHNLTVKLGYQTDAYLGNHILRMYACVGRLQDAMDVFTRVRKPNAFMWFSIISAYAKHGNPYEAIQLYDEMRRSGVKADAHVFAAALQACALAADLGSGRKVHSDVLQSGISADLFVGNSVVNMYAKCGELGDARRAFDRLVVKDVVTWNALLAGYAQHGLGQEALVLYGQMEREGLVFADDVTFVCLLNACANAGALPEGRQLHSQIVQRGQPDNIVLGNCLVNMYAKCGELEDARQVFDSLATKDVVTWNALIAGYAQQGLGPEALCLYGQMEQEGLLVASDVTLACLLKACASTGALQKARQLHSQIVQRGLLDNILVGTCLVDMYAKCGKLSDAQRVFNSLTTKNQVTWTALISAYGTCDEGHRALACFEEMLLAGIRPDDATFTCLLVACSHDGLVDEGRKLFDSMAEQHGINPTIEHYNCMIDLLGRAGHLDEAEKVLLSCECQSNVVGLTSLLNACKSHGDIERATRCFESLVILEPQQAPAYVLMANAYADAGRWSDVDRVETRRKRAGANKQPAVASIEVNKQLHTFLVGERREDIALKVDSTNAQLKQEGGHVPHTKLVLNGLGEKEKEHVLCGHAEKLALAFGLLNTPGGSPLVVTKNLRMCSDCHCSTEIMSRLERRDIVVRDGYRVHRFANGCCTCKGRP